MELYGHERTCPGLVNSKNEDSEVQIKGNKACLGTVDGLE